MLDDLRDVPDDDERHAADRLGAMLDAWGLSRAALVGLDMGGQPACAFAARPPDRVSRLTVMNSLVQRDEPTSWELRVQRWSIIRVQ